MSLLSKIKGTGPSGFGYGSTAEAVTEGLDLSGKNYLVTGCNSGLGLETARVLGLRGAQVVGAARTAEKAERACGQTVSKFLAVACELASPESVRSCTKKIREEGLKLDGIICNAGIMALPRLEQAFGYELQFFTNHVGHFILVSELIDLLRDDGRVVMLSSAAHTSAPKQGIDFDNLSGEQSYRPWTAYGQSKVANLLFAKELARRFEGSQRTANAVHPGVIKTNLARNMPAFVEAALGLVGPLALKSVPEGAATQCYVAAHPATQEISGEYFADCNVARSSTVSNDPELARRLWRETERIVAELN